MFKIIREALLVAFIALVIFLLIYFAYPAASEKFFGISGRGSKTEDASKSSETYQSRIDSYVEEAVASGLVPESVSDELSSFLESEEGAAFLREYTKIGENATLESTLQSAREKSDLIVAIGSEAGKRFLDGAVRALEGDASK